MDEPTAALSPHEVDALFERVRLLQQRGLAVLYISHRMKEIFELSRRITVLKDGRKVDTVASNAVRPGELVRMMVGRELDHYFPPRATAAEILAGPVRLQVHGGAVGKLHDIEQGIRALGKPPNTCLNALESSVATSHKNRVFDSLNNLTAAEPSLSASGIASTLIRAPSPPANAISAAAAAKPPSLKSWHAATSPP